MNCATCRRPMVRGRTQALTPGTVRHKAHGNCTSCTLRAAYVARRPQATNMRDLDANRLEDLTWMADTGENSIGAAARLGIDPKSLERWCQRHGHIELLRRLTARNPHPVTATKEHAA